MTVAHLITDSTFLPFVASTFDEAAPDENILLVWGSGTVRELPSHLRVEAIGTAEPDVARAVAVMSEARVAVFHSMSTFSAQVITALPPSTLRVWSGWGGEYSGGRFDAMAGLLGPATRRLVRGQSTVRERAVRSYDTNYLTSLMRAAARATDVFSAPVPTDLAVFRRRFPVFRGQYRQLNYASVEDTYATPPEHISGENVLIGNSATPENNHLEVLDLLARAGIGDRDIVTPLSYGDQAYADEVARAGSDRFGDRFVPLRGFLPLAEFTELVARCSVVVMGHRRQQALGTVARAVWQGAHVFLDRRNPILSYFRSVGLHPGTLDELSSDGIPEAPLSPDRVAADRRIARSLWGRDVVIANIRALLAEA